MMSKPRVGTAFGISSGDVLILPERHPACRRRESRLGSGTERENLAGDVKGKGASGRTARPKVPMHRRGADCLVVVMKAVMELERRGWVIAVDLGQPVRREEPFVQRKAAAFGRWHEPDEARVSSPDL